MYHPSFPLSQGATTAESECHCWKGVIASCTYVCIHPPWCLKTAIISLCCIYWLVFVTEKESVYCAVRTESLIQVQLTVWRDRMMFNLADHLMRFEDGRQWQVTCYTLLQSATRIRLHLPRTISTKGERVDAFQPNFNPLNPELNPICYLLALLGAHHFLHVSRIRVKSLTLRRLMSYIYGAPILDVSRSHTTTQHSR